MTVLKLADISGSDVMQQIRSLSDTPIMVLTHKKGRFALVELSDMGADSYMTMPLRQLEFIARIRAILRIREIMSIQEGVLIR